MATPENPIANTDDLDSTQSPSDPLTRGGSPNDKTGRDAGERPGLGDDPSADTFNDRTGR